MSLQEKITHKLIVPVTFEGVVHDVIIIRRIKAKDLRAFKQESQDIGEILSLIGKLSNWPPEGVDELDQADLEAISEIIAGSSKARGR